MLAEPDAQLVSMCPGSSFGAATGIPSPRTTVPFRAACGTCLVRFVDLAADAEPIARADGVSLNETVKRALAEAVERRRKDPEFKKRLRRIIEEDRELLARLAK